MRAIVFPGQGSQRRGMGAGLFERFPDLVREADAVLGYSIATLCLTDPDGVLNRTAFTQPAIYVVSCLDYRARFGAGPAPHFLAGHSVGEYAALEAAGAVDFATGLRLVQKRAEVMAEADGGRLAAVVGLDPDAVERLVAGCGIAGIEIANINSPTQVVVGGPDEAVRTFTALCGERGHRAVPLRVSGAFHTGAMAAARERFRDFLGTVTFRTPAIPVIANLTARPHDPACFADTLSRHVASPVLWMRSVEYLLAAGVERFEEIGTVPILTPMIAAIRAQATPVAAGFARAFGCSGPLVAGSLGGGIAGPALVSALARGGVLSMLDTEGLETAAVEAALAGLGADPQVRGRFGLSITADPENPDADGRLVDLAHRHAVRCVEARGYAEPSPALRRYRREAGNRIIARVQDADALAAFAGPPDGERAVDALCVDLHPWRMPGGGGAPFDLLRAALARRDALGPAAPFVGVSDIGGTPESVRGLLALGADFVMAGGVFLTADEAALDAPLRDALRAADAADVRLVPDWRHPAFATASLAFAEDGVARRAAVLQRLYLQDGITDEELQAAGLAGAPDAGPDAVRGWLRAAAVRDLRPRLIPCDGTLVPFNRRRRGAGRPSGFAALTLAEFLCPPRPPDPATERTAS